MLKHLLLVTLISPLILCAQLKVGQGILKINISNFPSMMLYADTLQESPLRKVEVKKDTSGEVVITDREEVDKWFKPEQLFLEYDIFMMRVDVVSGKWIQVYTDNERGITMWTRVDPNFEFIPWEKFLLKEISAIDKHPSFSLNIKISPADNSKTIRKIEPTDCFEVLEIKGSWMHIKTNLRSECNESKKIIKSGWIKWKQDGKLTINYSLMA